MKTPTSSELAKLVAKFNKEEVSDYGLPLTNYPKCRVEVPRSKKFIFGRLISNKGDISTVITDAGDVIQPLKSFVRLAGGR